MHISVQPTSLEVILPFRKMFLEENNMQIRYNAVHERGWADMYLLQIDGKSVGYGAIKGRNDLSDRDSIFEFYTTPSVKNENAKLFHELIQVSKAMYIDCQTNEPILTSMLFEFAQDIHAEAILFKDDNTTNFTTNDVVFREIKPDETVFEHHLEPIGKYVLLYKNEIVATGGFLLHYNMPFADLYMEVNSDFRQKGFGSYLLQEVKKVCYLSNRVPAARCNIDNKISKATLIKAGMQVCGYVVCGNIKVN
jgi:GNAT superfamily N-acetyltransferase